MKPPRPLGESILRAAPEEYTAWFSFPYVCPEPIRAKLCCQTEIAPKENGDLIRTGVFDVAVLKGNIGDSTTHLGANLETTATVIPVQSTV